MTAPLSQQPAQLKDASAIRKRKRRAPAGGAADDCFTCTKRNVKCDRRRPYCSQCLEVGNECSGYKTQLTWNVGVASRGKLRGLSLPIAKAPPVPREAKRSPARARAQTASTPTSQQWMDREAAIVSRQPIDIPVITAASAPATPYGAAGYDYLSISHHEQQQLPQGSWGSVSSFSGNAMIHSPDVTPKYSKFPFPLVTDNLSTSMGSVGSDVDYMSPISQSYGREEVPFMHSPNILYDGFTGNQSSPIATSPPSAPLVDYTRPPTSCPSLVYAPSEASSSLHSHLDAFESHIGQKLMREANHFSAHETTGATWPNHQMSQERQQQQQPPSPQEHQQMRNAENTGNNVRTSPRFPESSPICHAGSESQRILGGQDLLAKIPFFMDYYEHTLCPSMVLIDSASNPFREEILPLAKVSLSVQHAICALAACNLRMRRKLSLGLDAKELHERIIAEKRISENSTESYQGDHAIVEEYHHRNLAVQLLNEQLNDPVQSGHDSTLATILLLCHYRMAESGVAKFHTQFAGVKKILALRRAQQFATVGEPGWLESSFAYFDAISASINDREAQLAAPGLTEEAPLLSMGMENIVGCDRTLFKTISKLGRLNLLFQHRPVQSPAATPDEGNRFDGNGFGAKLNDEQILGSIMDDSYQSMFWREWKDARLALQTWQFDAAQVKHNLPATATAGQIQDLEFLSEAFRYAAMLYTERLANPALPTSHPNIQNLVSQVVYYATSLEANSQAEKFLLWPLFVAGSECANELPRNIVRSKCQDIMSRSGYMNNLAALDILEQLWSGACGYSEKPSSGMRRSPFNWNRCIGGPSSGVEWIMF